MNKLSALSIILCAALLASCAAQPPTYFYDLTSLAATTENKIDDKVTLGVGPVTLPQLLDRSGIVSRHHETGVNVASFHIWAGELEPTFIRVLTDSIATSLQHQTVWASPWDNRFRPEYQLRVFVDRFSGEINGQVQLSLSWSLLGEYGQQVISTHRYRASVASGKGYQGYVDALNQLLAGFADEVSVTLVERLSHE